MNFPRLIGLAWIAFGCLCLRAETIPPAPTHHFNDYAQVVSPATAANLDRALEDFERESSNQIVIAVYSRMQSRIR